MQTTAYAHRVELARAFDETVEAVVHELNVRGFGVLTWIDMQDKLKERLGVESRRYVLMGVCNPALAHRALSIEPDVGVFLPCTVAVYEEDPGRSVVVAMAPEAAMTAMGANPELESIATEAGEHVRSAVAALQTTG